MTVKKKKKEKHDAEIQFINILKLTFYTNVHQNDLYVLIWCIDCRRITVLKRVIHLYLESSLRINISCSRKVVCATRCGAILSRNIALDEQAPRVASRRESVSDATLFRRGLWRRQRRVELVTTLRDSSVERESSLSARVWHFFAASVGWIKLSPRWRRWRKRDYSIFQMEDSYGRVVACERERERMGKKVEGG